MIAMLLLGAATSVIDAPIPAIRTHAAVIGGSISDTLYPADARKAKTEGTAIVRFMVNEKGGPQDCKTFRSSGSDLLDAATCAAAMGLRFKAARDAAGHAVSEDFLFGIAWTMPMNLNVFGPKPLTSDQATRP